jgi:hypothetical protein
MFRKPESEDCKNNSKEMWKYYKSSIINRMKIWIKHIRVILKSYRILLKQSGKNKGKGMKRPSKKNKHSEKRSRIGIWKKKAV